MLVGVVEIYRAPLDVENTIGRSARDRRIDAAGAARESCATLLGIRLLVVPVWQDSVVVRRPRQANVTPVVIRSRELGIAIGRQVDAVEALIVQRENKWQCNVGHYVIPMIANVVVAWDDAATFLYNRAAWDWRRCSSWSGTERRSSCGSRSRTCCCRWSGRRR
jgi:hypothetical protein